MKLLFLLLCAVTMSSGAQAKETVSAKVFLSDPSPFEKLRDFFDNAKEVPEYADFASCDESGLKSKAGSYRLLMIRTSWGFDFVSEKTTPDQIAEAAKEFTGQNGAHIVIRDYKYVTKPGTPEVPAKAGQGPLFPGTPKQPAVEAEYGKFWFLDLVVFKGSVGCKEKIATDRNNYQLTRGPTEIERAVTNEYGTAYVYVRKSGDLLALKAVRHYADKRPDDVSYSYGWRE